MKIAVAAKGQELDAEVENRFGLAPYLLIVDVDTLDFEAVPLSSDRGGAGSGIESVAIAVEKNARTIIAGYVSPTVSGPLRKQGIEVYTSMSGTVRDMVEKFRRGDLVSSKYEHTITAGKKLLLSIKQTAKQFISIIPILIGVVLLIGLFQAFVSKEILFSLLSGRHVPDTLTGAFFGSLFSGNPVNSYVIGSALVNLDVSLYAVTALLVTWVTVGIIQLPVEISMLGWRFALSRTIVSFIFAVPISIFTVYILRLLE